MYTPFVKGGWGLIRLFKIPAYPRSYKGGGKENDIFMYLPFRKGDDMTRRCWKK